MQGQRSTIDSFPETFECDHGSSTSNSGVDRQLFWGDMLNPVESRLPDFLLSPSDTNITYANAVSRDGRSLSGWSLGESSSSDNTRNQTTHDEAKMDHGWSSSLTTHAGPGPRLDERRYEPTILSLESVNINLNQVANGPLFLQNSSSDGISQNLNLNAGYAGNNDNGVQVVEAGICHPYKPGGSETEHIPSAGGSADPFGTASGSTGYLTEESDGRPGSLDGRRLSCKRKALEGVSGQLSLGGSPSCFQRAENSVWHAVPARYNASSSSSIPIPTENLFAVNPPELLNPQFGVGMGGVASDSHPALSVAGNAESSQRNFRMRVNPAHHQDSAPTNLSSTGNAIRRSHIWSPYQSSSRIHPFNQPMDLRPTATNTTSQSQSHTMHIPSLPRNVHPFPWSGASNARVGGSSSSPVIPGERTTLREDVNSRSMPRNISEHPMFVPATEMRNLAQDPTNWSLANGNISIPGNVASTSRVGSSSVVHRSPAPNWVPPRNPPTQYPRRLSEVVRRSLFSSAGSETGGQSSNFTPLRSGPSASAQEMVLSSAGGHQGHHQPYPRSALWMDRQGDGVLGLPLSVRTLAAASEGRSRLLSEIRNVLDFVRRGGDGLRFEDVLILDQSVLFGVTDLHDRHRDMRLDVDNMSYEELLALEERIGNVSTGLSEETILKCLKHRKYISFTIGAPSEVEPCCICQEEYVEGEDLGTLDCGHDFHTDCVKQWLTHKNLCPICKTTALVT